MWALTKRKMLGIEWKEWTRDVEQTQMAEVEDSGLGVGRGRKTICREFPAFCPGWMVVSLPR
jgi:hypothetical protein